MRTRTGITVSGTGTASAVPDTAELQLAAECGSSSVQGAVEKAAAAIAAMRTALVEHGVAEKDIRSSAATVHVEHGRSGPRGYLARFGLAASVRQVADSGEVAQAALMAGGDASRMDSLSFAHSQPDALHDAAREAAFAEARRKAEQLAALAGQALGVIEEVAEGGGDGGGVPRPMVARMMAEDSMAFHAGEQEVAVSVTVRWAWA